MKSNNALVQGQDMKVNDKQFAHRIVLYHRLNTVLDKAGFPSAIN